LILKRFRGRAIEQKGAREAIIGLGLEVGKGE
jgi:hypothetical protein